MYCDFMKENALASVQISIPIIENCWKIDAKNICLKTVKSLNTGRTCKSITFRDDYPSELVNIDETFQLRLEQFWKQTKHHIETSM